MNENNSGIELPILKNENQNVGVNTQSIPENVPLKQETPVLEPSAEPNVNAISNGPTLEENFMAMPNNLNEQVVNETNNLQAHTSGPSFEEVKLESVSLPEMPVQESVPLESSNLQAETFTNFNAPTGEANVNSQAISMPHVEESAPVDTPINNEPVAPAEEPLNSTFTVTPDVSMQKEPEVNSADTFKASSIAPDAPVGPAPTIENNVKEDVKAPAKEKKPSKLASLIGTIVVLLITAVILYFIIRNYFLI